MDFLGGVEFSIGETADFKPPIVEADLIEITFIGGQLVIAMAFGNVLFFALQILSG